MDPRETATILQHYADSDVMGAISPPIFQASNFTMDGSEEWRQASQNNPSGPPYIYSRLGNPTVHLAEEKLAKLEGTEAAKVTGCGQGAIATTVLGCTGQGSHVVCVDTAYGPVRELLDGILSRFGVTATYVSGLDTDELLDAIKPETSLVYLESPSSVVMRLQDLETITRHCREKKVTTAIDNTYATPLYQNPHALGVDVVLHSASKYLGGHSDLNGGVICGAREWIDKITRWEINLLGTILAPFPAWLLVRGLRTLQVRLKQHEASADRIAQWMETQPGVEKVNHVSLESFAQRDLYRKQMRGSSGLFSFEPTVQDEAKVRAFVAHLNYFRLAVSWGGFESLVVPIKTQPIGYEQSTWVIRLFVGLEDPAELIEDLDQALHASGLA